MIEIEIKISFGNNWYDKYYDCYHQQYISLIRFVFESSNLINIILITPQVSKTTKELVLRWKDDGAPIDISDEVKMPQFEIFKIVDTRCQETMHIGN